MILVRFHKLSYQFKIFWAVGGIAVIFSGPFEAEEIDLQLGHILVEQKGTPASSKQWRFRYGRGGTSENPGKIDFAIQIFGF